MDFLAGLNAAQKEAVTTIEGPILTLAGPGSGKTRALTHRIAHLIEDEGIAPWRILAVTFTNKAAKEMRTRLADMLPERDVYRLNVGTFHSLCARWLRREVDALGRYGSNFVIYDTNDQQAVIKKSLRELNLDDKRWRPNAIHRVISNAKNEMIAPDNFQARTYQEEIMGRLYEKYQALLLQNNAMDFDDLLLVAYSLFKELPDVLERYQENYLHVMVDEFQDTNLVQYNLTQMLSQKHKNLFVVGDPDQGIYSWRGADYRNVMHFQQDYPQHKLIQLSQNYRSTDTIVSAAKQIIRKNQQRLDNNLFTERGAGVKIKVVEKYDGDEEARFVADEVRRVTAEAAVKPGDVAIMYRTNAQSRLLEEAFISRGMPYLLVRGTRFYDRKEIKDALAYLRVIHNPADAVSLSRIINVPARSIGSKTLIDLDRWAFEQNLSPMKALLALAESPDLNVPFSARAYNALKKFGQLMKLLMSSKERLNLVELFDLLMARSGYKEFVADGTEEGEDRWNNLVELRRSMDRFGSTLAQEVLGQFLEEISLVADSDALEDSSEATALLTLHTAKGLEFPIVFMVGMEEGLFPHSRSADDAERMEEERRLAYVGVTRAKDQLYLTRAFRRQQGYSGFAEPTEPSRFLRDISPDLLENGNQGNQKRSKRAKVSQTIRDTAQTLAAKYKTGDKVQHFSFGKGTVISSKIDGSDEYVQVAFPGNGIKTFSANFAKLEHVS